MGWWLCDTRKGQETGVISRFDPRFWTVNFPRPMMAGVTTTGPDRLRVDAVLYRKNDLAGLIWEAEDRFDHPLLAYETARDFRGCRLAFRWRSSGVKALDAVNGPTLTIEGRDAEGAAATWYVRLWNYAVGTAEDALVSLDFAALQAGFSLPGAAVWAGDVDRMFVSLVAPEYDGSDAALSAPVEAWVEVSEINCEGPGAVLTIGDVLVPEHGLGVATGYDDCCNQTPERVLRNAFGLGYRGELIHYVGMSHYPALAEGLASGGLNVAAAAWHADFAARAEALGFGLIWSLSYELLDQMCPDAWKQRAWDGTPALTGWVPPSALLSPACDAAMVYLQDVARTFVGIALDAGLHVKFQIGEPWWWLMPDGRPCLYDEAARAALGDLEIADVRGSLSGAQLAVLDAAGALLAESTAALVAAVKDVAPEAVTHLLTYLPTVLDGAAWRRAALPVGWHAPAFDVLQIEDYDWAAAGRSDATARGVAAVEDRLGYPASSQHYLAGFVARPEDRAEWAAIDAAAEAARRRGVARAFVWALPQVIRDGFVHFDHEEDAVEAFDDLSFPLALGREVEVSPEFSTAIVTSAGGHEARNAAWAEARTSYDVGPGVRSEADIAALLAFFRARMGPARAFRLRDPFDWQGLGEVLAASDGETSRFALVKHYDGRARRITRPVAGSVRLFLDGVETHGFSVAEGGWVELDDAPGGGLAVTASFDFDVPVRFAEDRLSVNRATFLAGAAPNVPLIEVREA